MNNITIAGLYQEFKDAVEEEHTYNCNSNTCDVYAAHEEGCYLLAAHLLVGATECPRTETAWVQYTNLFGDTKTEEMLAAEIEALDAAVDSTKCLKCCAVVWFTDGIPNNCDNCGEDVLTDKEYDDRNDNDT